MIHSRTTKAGLEIPDIRRCEKIKRLNREYFV